MGPSYALAERNAGYTNAMSSSAAAAPRGGIVPPNWQLSHSRAPSDCSSSVHGGHCILASLASVGRGAEHTSDDGYAYYLDRGNGQLTRLIPADVLPPLNEIPAREPETRGMVVLPPLRAGPPKGAIEMNYPVTVKKHIDRISNNTSPSTSKKTKIYCDKWIHEGVCAFTQQGCKYKHEMPFDEGTQHSLGLFQGFPGWWRKRQEELKRHSAGSDMGMSFSAGKEQVWKDGPAGRTSGAVSPTKSQDPGVHQAVKTQVVPFIWGPIGPPSKSLSGSNPWSTGTMKLDQRF